jgi:hypothetical protein
MPVTRTQGESARTIAGIQSTPIAPKRQKSIRAINISLLRSDDFGNG